MAGRPKKDVVEETTKEIKETKEINKDAEIEELKNTVAMLMKQMNAITTTPNEITKDSKYGIDDDIEVISQCDGELNLRLGRIGDNDKDVYTFKEFGEVQAIPFGDLKEIVKFNKSFAENGVFYVNDEKAVKQLKLEKYYKRLINVKDMEGIFKKEPKDFVETFKLASKGQQNTIVQLIMNKLYDKQEIDANILIEIGTICGKDLLKVQQDNKE